MFSPAQGGSHDFHRRRYQQPQVPAFGSWDCFQDVDDLSRCFEAARQAGYIRYATADSDLYVTGDFYEDHVVTPTMIVVPRPMAKAVVGDPTRDEKETGWTHDDDGVGGDLYEDDYFGRKTKIRRNPKPVDEDLYKISPGLLRSIKSKNGKKRGVLRFLTSCLVPCAS